MKNGIDERDISIMSCCICFDLGIGTKTDIVFDGGTGRVAIVSSILLGVTNLGVPVNNTIQINSKNISSSLHSKAQFNSILLK